MGWKNMDEGFGKELDCRAVSGVCVLSWILLVEQLTNNGPTLDLHWTYTLSSLSPLSPLSQRAGMTLLHDWFFGPKWIKNVLYEKKCVSLQM